MKIKGLLMLRRLKKKRIRSKRKVTKYRLKKPKDKKSSEDLSLMPINFCTIGIFMCFWHQLLKKQWAWDNKSNSEMLSVIFLSENFYRDWSGLKIVWTIKSISKVWISGISLFTRKTIEIFEHTLRNSLTCLKFSMKAFILESKIELNIWMMRHNKW